MYRVQRPTPASSTASRARPFATHAPVYDLVAAGGGFGPDVTVGTATEEIGWMQVPGHVRLTRDHFVARVEGHSMEPTIPDGSYCLFRTDRGGSREGKLVLVWHRGCTDPALGGEFSVKKYTSTKTASPGGRWSHREIRLKPLNPDPAYGDLVFDPGSEGDLRVVGEIVCVLEAADDGESMSGRADYVLYDQNGRPLAVIEAKKNAINPYVAKQQALPYAKALQAPFIFLTNGELNLFLGLSERRRPSDRRFLLATGPGADGGDGHQPQNVGDRGNSGVLHSSGGDTHGTAVPTGGDAGARPSV